MGNFNDVIMTALQTIITVTVPLVSALIIYGVKKATNWLKSKTENETVDTYLSRAYSMLEDIVVTTSETYVKSLKADGKFDIEEQQQAFEITKNAFEQIASTEIKNAIKSTVADYDAWVRNTVEAIIANTK
nr:MAG TPA: holin [Caudoviricetes sp.]